MRRAYLVCLSWLVVGQNSLARADALDKLKPEQLVAVHESVGKLHVEWQKLSRPGPYKEYRANLHVHSHLSHDSRGAIADIVRAARRVGTDVLMFTEHPADHYDYFKDGHRDIRDGVLLIPGAETEGFLAFPTGSLRGLTSNTPQEFADLVRRRGGLVFLSHLEERMGWQIRGLTGTEIYNTHANFKDQKALLAALRNPLWIWKSVSLFQKYPQEAFSALQDYPSDYLRRWDQLCQVVPHTGIAANDAHQNIGLVIRLGDGNKARFEDALAKKLFELDAAMVPGLPAIRPGQKAGDVLYRVQLDPYENSLRHVGTHLLMNELSARAVWDALEAGRAFVAFDWLADARGFDYAVYSQGQRNEMGSRVRFADGLEARARAPLPVQWKLIRDGRLHAEARGRSFAKVLAEPGVYRIEAWLSMAGERMIWILSNPVYVHAKATP